MSCILMIFTSYGIYFGWRNSKVGAFRIRINHLCYNFSTNNPYEESAYDWCYKKMPDYSKMLYSFKPLKLEAWLDRATVERLKAGIRPIVIE